MAIVPMTNAVPGTVALSAEYNKLITNILDLDTRTTAVEAAVGGGTGEVPRKGGEWTFGASTQSIAQGTLLTQWSAIGTPSGVSHSAGVFTLTEAGLYVLAAGVRFTNGPLVSSERCVWIAGAHVNTIFTENSSSGYGLNVSTSTIRRLPAGQTLRVYAYIGTGSTTIGRENASDINPTVSIYKVGN